MISTPLILMIAFFLAFLIEALTEYLLGTPFTQIPKLTPYKWLLMYVSAAFGIVAAFIYRLDLVAIMSEYIGAPIAVHTFGIILTGLAIGRGANFLHGVIQKILVKPTFTEEE